MMKQRAIFLGRILGIPIEIDYSWFLIFVLLTWTLAVGYYPQEFKHWPIAEYWVVGAITAIMLFVSVLLHELGHSAVALHYKIHVRSITLFIFGGISQIATEPPSAKIEFLIAIAGPIVSFALGGLFASLRYVVGPFAPLLALMEYLAYINVILGAFNLIPGFPLDGGRVFRAAVWGVTGDLRRATDLAGNVGKVIGYLFIFIGVWQMFSGNFINGLWIAFIGWFLDGAAASQMRQQRLQDLLAGHLVGDAMSRRYASISPDTTLQGLVDEHILGSGGRSFIVERDGNVIGLLTPHLMASVPRNRWPETQVTQVMISGPALRFVQPDTDLWQALAQMDRDGVNQLPVVLNGRIVGMLTREDIISYLRTLARVPAH